MQDQTWIFLGFLLTNNRNETICNFWMKSFKIKYLCLQFHPATLEVFFISKLLSFQFKSPIPFYFVLKNILNSKHVFSKLTQNQGDTKIELRLNKKLTWTFKGNCKPAYFIYWYYRDFWLPLIGLIDIIWRIALITNTAESGNIFYSCKTSITMFTVSREIHLLKTYQTILKFQN